MSLRITVNDDFSANAIGWSAPTSVAPLVMALPASGTANMANKVSGGPKQTVFSGLSVPALTGGVKGTQLPFITCKNGAAGIDTGVACSSNMTLAILARASDISAETPLIGSYGLAGAPRVAVSAIGAGKMHTLVSNPYSTGGSMDKDNANVGNNEWALYVLRVASASASLSILMSDLTNGITAAATYAATAADTGSGPEVLVGTYQGFATGSGSLDVAAYAAWNSNLTDTDVALFQTFMRNYAAVYGQTC